MNSQGKGMPGRRKPQWIGDEVDELCLEMKCLSGRYQPPKGLTTGVTLLAFTQVGLGASKRL